MLSFFFSFGISLCCVLWCMEFILWEVKRLNKETEIELEDDLKFISITTHMIIAILPTSGKQSYDCDCSCVTTFNKRSPNFIIGNRLLINMNLGSRASFLILSYF